MIRSPHKNIIVRFMAALMPTQLIGLSNQKSLLQYNKNNKKLKHKIYVGSLLLILKNLLKHADFVLRKKL